MRKLWAWLTWHAWWRWRPNTIIQFPYGMRVKRGDRIKLMYPDDTYEIVRVVGWDEDGVVVIRGCDGTMAKSDVHTFADVCEMCNE